MAVTTVQEAYILMARTLSRISEQFVNKDGMTGGRCVELAQEVMAEIKAASLSAEDLPKLESDSAKRLRTLLDRVKFAISVETERR